MKNDAIIRLDRSRKALLAATVAALLVLPVVLGVPMAGAPARAQAAPGLVIRTVDPEPGRAGAEPVRLKLGGIDETLWLRRDGQIAGNVLAEAQVATGPDGHPVIMMRFTPGAQGLFADMTTKNVGRRIALLVDGEVINAPVVLEPMPRAGVQLSGDFDMERARLLAARMMGKPILP